MSDNKRTPLYPFHEKLKARFVPFGGWDMPVSYTKILEEHTCVRKGLGLFDVSHMGEALVEGEEASEFLNYLITNDIDSMTDGKALYSPMCSEDGNVIDDVISYRYNKNKYFICLNASNTDKDIAWMEKNLGNFKCTVKNCSDEYGQIAIQGPRSLPFLNELFDFDMNHEIPRFHFKEIEIEGTLCIVSRTGYTGEDGCEIYIPTDKTLAVTEYIFEKGKSHNLTPIGLGARDSLRLEVGYPLYGHEISDAINPLKAGLGWCVKLKKEANFIGKENLTKEKEAGLTEKVIFYTLDDKRIARQDTPVLQNDKPIGKVLSGTFSPVINKPIGSALVKTADLDTGNLFFDLRGNKVALKVARPPLHK